MRTVIGFLIVLLVTTACESQVLPYEKYKEVIRPGMEREAAIEVLQESAWYHQECPRGAAETDNFFVTDLFFFGNHQYDKAEIFIVVSYPTGKKLVVDHIGTLEPYAWHTGYADCIQRERFED
jgi:hypothetical protein